MDNTQQTYPKTRRLEALRIQSPFFSKTRTPQKAELAQTNSLQLRGHGPNKHTAILMIHGFTITPACFYAYGHRLNEAGYSVSAPLLPGHGGRPEELHTISREQWLNAVIQEYDRLKQNHSRIVVAGISLGGLLGIQLAVRRPLAYLFLLGPMVYPIPLFAFGRYTILPLMRTLSLPYWVNVAGDVRKPDGFELGYGRTSVRGLIELYSFMLETRPLLENVQTDVTLFQGRRDREVPPNRAPSILEKLGSPNKELIWLDNSGHEIPRDYDAELVIEHMLNTLRSRFKQSTRLAIESE